MACTLKRTFPQGACSGTTADGRRCGTRDVFENGRCRHHGGTGKLLRTLIKEARQQAREAAAEDRRNRWAVYAYLKDAPPEAFKAVARLIESRARKATSEKRPQKATDNLRGDEPQGDPLSVQAAPAR